MTNSEAIKYLIRPLSTSTSDGEEKQKEFEAYKMAIEALEKQKTGHFVRWYEVEEKQNGEEYIPQCKCSECGTSFEPYTSNFIKYCYVCGAKMEMEE